LRLANSTRSEGEDRAKAAPEVRQKVAPEVRQKVAPEVRQRWLGSKGVVIAVGTMRAVCDSAWHWLSADPLERGSREHDEPGPAVEVDRPSHRASAATLPAMVILLDGPVGTELAARGVATPAPLWSAAAIESAPEVLAAIHRDHA